MLRNLNVIARSGLHSSRSKAQKSATTGPTAPFRYQLIPLQLTFGVCDGIRSFGGKRCEAVDRVVCICAQHRGKGQKRQVRGCRLNPTRAHSTQRMNPLSHTRDSLEDRASTASQPQRSRCCSRSQRWTRERRRGSSGRRERGGGRRGCAVLAVLSTRVLARGTRHPLACLCAAAAGPAMLRSRWERWHLISRMMESHAVWWCVVSVCDHSGNIATLRKSAVSPVLSFPP